MRTLVTNMLGRMQLDTPKLVKQGLFHVLNECIYLQKARNELSRGQKACYINFQTINGLLVLREGVSELLLAPITTEKRTGSETTEIK